MGAGEIVETYADGEAIVREGDNGRQMYVIQRGAVRITKRVGEADAPLAELSRGDFFGEMSLLESLPRDASATAIGDTKLLVINPGGLLIRIRRDPTFAFEMLHRLSGRIRSQNARLVEAVQRLGETSEAAQGILYGPREHAAVDLDGRDG
jgi:CRP-like cAMP-binding protein